MLDPNDKKEVETMIKDALRLAMDFPTRKRGDTPTDMLQLVPKKYVDSMFGTALFDFTVDAGNSGTTETDLYSSTIAASQLGVNGAKLEATYGGTFVSSGTATRQVRAYFNGTLIFDTGALTLSLSSAWTLYITAIRVSASVVRTVASFTTEGAALAAYTDYTEITGLTLSNSNILKVTGTAAGAGAATNDIVAKLGSVYYFPAA